jgi:hypothetical protein
MTLTESNVGDILYLDFFDKKRFKAEISKVRHDINGVTAVTAKIQGAAFGLCYLAIAEDGVLINVKLPESGEQFMTAGTAGASYLAEYKSSDLAKDVLECEDILPPADAKPASSGESGGPGSGNRQLYCAVGHK